MTQRLPTPGGDNGDWGDILNDFLDVSHNPDGTLANNTVGTNQLQSGSITNAQLDSSTQSAISKANNSLQTTQLGTNSGVAQLDGSGKLTTTQLPSSVVSVSAVGYLPLPSGDTTGATDTAALNTVLASGGTIRPNPLVDKPVYYISRSGSSGTWGNWALVLAQGGNTDVDFGDAEISLVSNSGPTEGLGRCSMLVNWATFNPQRTVHDAAITVDQGVVTSATANFTSADVESTIVIAGAGPDTGTLPLTAQIGSINSATSANLVNFAGSAASAGATVSDASASIFVRDQNIKIVGGNWNRGSANDGAGTLLGSHSIVLQHVDNLNVDLTSFQSALVTGPKYALFPADVRNYDLCIRSIYHQSDGIHVNGPATNGAIHDTGGYTNDDFVSIGGADNTQLGGLGGDITGLTIKALRPLGIGSPTPVSSAKLYGTVGTTVSDVLISDIRGAYGLGFIDIGAADVTGATFDEIAVEDIVTDSPNIVDLNGSGGSITISNVTTSYGEDTEALNGVTIASGTSWDSITIDRISAPNGASTETTGSSCVFVQGTTGTLRLRDVDWNNPSNGSLVRFYDSEASITSLFIDDFVVADGSELISNSAGTLTRAWIGKGTLSDAAYLADLVGTTTLHLAGTVVSSPTGGSLHLRATAHLTVLGDDLSEISGSVVTVSGYALRVNAPTLPLDISLITTADLGDRAYNSNSGLSCGVGPVICTIAGSTPAWKNEATGSTYTP